MTRLLFALEKFPPEYTGAGLRALKTAGRMSGTHDIRIVCLSQGNLGKDEARLSITRLKCPSSEDAKVFAGHIICLMHKAGKYLKRESGKFDTIHFYSFTWVNRIIMLYNLMFYRKKTILDVTLEGQDDPVSLLRAGLKNRLASPITGFLLRRLDIIIVSSEPARQSCIKAGIKPDRIRMLPHGCDENEFGQIKSSKRPALRKKLRIAEGAFVFMNVGKLQERKNQLAIVKAFCETAKSSGKRGTKAGRPLLVLVGPYNEGSKYLERIKSAYEAEGMLGSVMITGKQANVNEYLACADALVFASGQEGFPNVIVESLMSGTPVITTEQGCLDRYLGRQEGLEVLRTSGLSDDSKASAIAEAMQRAWLSKKRANRKSIRTDAIRNFSSRQIDARISEIYSEVAGK